MTHGERLGALAATLSFLGALVVPAAAQTSGDRFLPRRNFVITSTLRIDMTKDTATLPLHKGTFKGMGVYYVITDTSDQQAARTLGVNFAPRLAVITNGCPGCAETVSSTNPTLGKGEVTFTGVPDFQGTRILTPGPKGFPPAKVQPGGAADLHYSPLVKIAGSPIVYNASIVAVGGPPYDVIKHTNTADRVLAIDTKKMTVDLLVVQAYAYGKRILYLSSEASDPLTASLERATFTPGLGLAPFAGGGAYPAKSARAEIFTFANGKVPNPSPPGQGLAHVILSGADNIDASYADRRAINALNAGGDAHNVLDNWPILPDIAMAHRYSPLWDLQIGVFTKKAVAAGLNGTYKDGNTIRWLSVKKMVTSPGGVLPLGPANIVINCPALAFVDGPPVGPQMPLPPHQP